MKRSLAILLAIALITTFSGCANNSSTPTDKKTSDSDTAEVKQIVNYYINADPDTLDPARADDGNKNSIVGEVQEGLVRMLDGALQPAGAESWTISDDGLVWTFKLRDNKYFDGSSVVADDYVNSVQRIFDPEVNCHNAGIFYCITGGEAFNTGKGPKEDVGVKAINEKTLEFTLAKPIPYFTELLNFSNVSPVPRAKTAGEKNASYGATAEEMSYSGPFYIDSWTRGSDVIMKKNPNYWDATSVKLNQINAKLVLEEQTREQMFEMKELDILRNVKSEYAQRVQPKIDSGEAVLIEGPSPRFAYICFNNNDPSKLFTNVKVRKAFSLAIDREIFVNNVIKKDKAAYGLVPFAINNGSTIFREVTPEPLLASKDQDPKALLEEGLKELGLGAPETITVTFLQKNSNSDTKVQGEYYQNQWQTKLGVNVKIDTAADNSTFNNTVSKGNYQVCQTGWGADYNDPMTFMQCYVTNDGNNPAFFSNAKYDELIIACQTEKDMDVRLQKFTEAEKILVDEFAGIGPINFTFSKNVVSGHLKGAVINGAGGPAVEFKNAYIK